MSKALKQRDDVDRLYAPEKKKDKRERIYCHSKLYRRNNSETRRICKNKKEKN